MNKYSRCPIWDIPASEESTDGRDGRLIDLPRAGGRYFIARTAIACLTQLDERGKARLTSWLVDQRRLGFKCPEIDSNTITTAKQRQNLSVLERADRLLQYIEDQTVEIGTEFVFTPKEMLTTAIGAWSESLSQEEVQYLLNYLDKQGWIALRECPSDRYTIVVEYNLTGEGYARLVELEKANAESSKGFVVMSDDLTNLPTEPEKKVLNAESKMRDVFVIHGRNDGTKETVARFIERLGLNPIILHEQPNQGQTIIEKFERHAEVAFAIALLTPDDTGSLAGEEQSLKPRARQNVIFEFGYFMGKLGRQRVCALKEENVEIPSDYDGVLYISLDASGAWKMELAKELKNAGFEVDMNRVLE